MADQDIPHPSLVAARKAFLVAVQEIRPQLHRYCARMCGSALDGEDLVQETLATGYYKLSLMNRGVPLRAWLFKIAHNKCIDFLRAAHPHEEWTLAAHDEGISFEDQVETQQESHRALRRLVLLLPPMERSCVILKDVLDHDLNGIAQMLSTNVGAVKAALHRGRQKLKSVPAKDTRPAANSAELLGKYVERFNAKDWDGLYVLLKADVECEVVGSWAAVGPEAIRDEYFSRYAGFEFPWRISLGRVDDEIVVVCWKQSAGRWILRALARISWDRGEICRIRDYIYIPYLLADAEVIEITE